MVVAALVVLGVLVVVDALVVVEVLVVVEALVAVAGSFCWRSAGKTCPSCTREDAIDKRGRSG